MSRFAIVHAHSLNGLLKLKKGVRVKLVCTKRVKGIQEMPALQRVVNCLSRLGGSISYEVPLNPKELETLTAYAKLLYLPPEELVDQWTDIKKAALIEDPRFYQIITGANDLEIYNTHKLQTALELLHQEIQPKLVALAKLHIEKRSKEHSRTTTK